MHIPPKDADITPENVDAFMQVMGFEGDHFSGGREYEVYLYTASGMSVLFSVNSDGTMGDLYNAFVDHILDLDVEYEIENVRATGYSEYEDLDDEAVGELITGDYRYFRDQIDRMGELLGDN